MPSVAASPSAPDRPLQAPVRRKRRARTMTALGATCVIAVSGLVGYAFGHGNGSSASSPTRVAAFPSSLGSSPGGQSQGSSGQSSGGVDGNTIAQQPRQVDREHHDDSLGGSGRRYRDHHLLFRSRAHQQPRDRGLHLAAGRERRRRQHAHREGARLRRRRRRRAGSDPERVRSHPRAARQLVEPIRR